MSLSGLGFAFFFPLVWAAHWLLPRRAGIQNGFLLVSSYVFYASWRLELLPVLCGLTLADYVVTRRMDVAGSDTTRRRWFTLGVFVNLAPLLTFKYLGFFTASLGQLLDALGIGASIDTMRLLLPLGISYYTLMKLGALIDVYYRRIPACRSLLAYATFVSFFPQIIAGPIGRATSLFPQYASARRLRPDVFGSGLATFFLGFVMKACIGDRLAALYVNPVFGDHLAYGATEHWIGLVAYAAQLFCDFAGYSLLAIGSGRMLGIQLPRNFDYPLFSRGMLEVWRRWHISLNTWLFDYIFSPMTTGRGVMRGRLSLGFMITFFVSGLWHGAAWTFVLWGIFQGLALVVQFRWDVFYKSLCRRDRVWVTRRKSAPYAVGAWALTHIFFLLTLILFRAPSVAEALAYFRGLFASSGTETLPLAPLNVLVLVGFLVVYHLLGLSRSVGVRAAWSALPAPVRGVVLGAAVVAVAILLPVSEGTFIYAQF